MSIFEGLLFCLPHTVKTERHCLRDSERSKWKYSLKKLKLNLDTVGFLSNTTGWMGAHKQIPNQLKQYGMWESPQKEQTTERTKCSIWTADAYKYLFKECFFKFKVMFCIKNMNTTFKNKLAYLKNKQYITKQIKNKVKKRISALTNING